MSFYLVDYEVRQPVHRDAALQTEAVTLGYTQLVLTVPSPTFFTVKWDDKEWHLIFTWSL